MGDMPHLSEIIALMRLVTVPHTRGGRLLRSVAAGRWCEPGRVVSKIVETSKAEASVFRH